LVSGPDASALASARFTPKSKHETIPMPEIIIDVRTILLNPVSESSDTQVAT
jgi:hypothetical protein